MHVSDPPPNDRRRRDRTPPDAFGPDGLAATRDHGGSEFAFARSHSHPPASRVDDGGTMTTTRRLIEFMICSNQSWRVRQEQNKIKPSRCRNARDGTRNAPRLGARSPSRGVHEKLLIQTAQFPLPGRCSVALIPQLARERAAKWLLPLSHRVKRLPNTGNFVTYRSRNESEISLGHPRRMRAANGHGPTSFRHEVVNTRPRRREIDHATVTGVLSCSELRDFSIPATTGLREANRPVVDTSSDRATW